ncbi:citrate/2-methylcitrate synthase [Candidatus Magnetaquicoccus inordinatus]|uniref:citrate/2-methylcitrate synthase n=1 Tax=Candidatus Magnetaquicoccus inordinatus TaxID=2496818 RepID=UPI00102BBDCB|nr:citrate/2-methylcitrate synthase [Candidatus Magnetaquicoccus inordinatus]
MKKAIKQDEKRKGVFAEQITTHIWQELPSAENPYLAQASYCHGYDLMTLMERCSFEDMLLLLLQGELPTAERKELLRQLMIALANPGPRHPATRAAITAGVGKSNPMHILPIALTILGGEHMGAGEVSHSMEFLRYHIHKDPQQVVKERLALQPRPEQQQDWVIAAGFGSCFGGIDPLAHNIAARLSALAGAGKALRWGVAFADALQDNGMGWRIPGVAAAAFLDMNFSGMTPWVGATLFQLLSAPGMLAHGLEYRLQPLTAYPFIQDNQYIIESDAQTN